MEAGGQEGKRSMESSCKKVVEAVVPNEVKA